MTDEEFELKINACTNRIMADVQRQAYAMYIEPQVTRENAEQSVISTIKAEMLNLMRYYQRHPQELQDYFKMNDMAKEIHYKEKGYNCITPCPYKEEYNDCIIMVGSITCGGCNHCEKQNYKKKVVICNHE